MLDRQSDVTVTLPREQMQSVYELTIAKAVVLEGTEDMAMADCGSREYRKAADAIREALDA